MQLWLVILVTVIYALHCTESDSEKCDMTDWTEWSACTATCAPLAKRYRTRKCLDTSCFSGSCGSRKTKQIEKCSNGLECCRGYPKWQKWGSWTLKCGNKKVYRKRSCIKCVPNKGCHTYPNMGPPFYVQRAQFNDSCPPRCQRPPKWLQWTEWGDCLPTGTRQRSRICKEANICPDGSVCLGQTISSKDSKECKKNCSTCQERCQWTKWSDWAACHGECDKALQVRIRDCVGKGRCIAKCEGPSSEIQPCWLWCCRDMRLNPWEPWSDCLPSCALGNRTRVRRCWANNCPWEEEQCNAIETKQTKMCTQKDCRDGQA